MVSTGHLLAFSAAALAIIVVPGPSVLFVIGRALTLGRKGALATVVGNTAGAFVLVLAVSVGIGALVERSVAVFTAVKLIGAAYLIYLGAQAVRHRGALSTPDSRPESRKTTRRIVGEGFVVGISNPKAVVFFAAVLPQFVDRSAGRTSPQLLVLGTVFVVIALVSDTAWALAAGAARSWFARSPRRLELVGGAGGLLMIGIGTSIALTGRPD